MKEKETKKLEQYLKDRKIGNLIWSERSPNAMNWNDAKQYCANLEECGFDDWRMPNIDELRTTIKNCSKTEPGGKCKVSEKNGCLANKCWHPLGSCSCLKKDNYSKLGDNNDITLWSFSFQSSSKEVWSVWSIWFSYGQIIDFNINYNNYVRCVRNAD